MFGCGEMMSAATASELPPKAESNGLATIVSGDACAAHGAHDCCAKKAEASQAKTQNTKRLPLKLEALLAQREALNNIPSNGVAECPLALSRAIAISKVGDRRDLAVANAVVEPFATLPSSEFKATVTPAARLPNLGHTYLRCCVFLI